MNPGHMGLAILLSGLAISMTDWFFSGILFHEKYFTYPEIWRQSSESRTIPLAILLGFVTCATFVLACSAFHVHGYAGAFQFAAVIWLIAPLPLLITNALYIKLHPLTVLSHALGWLAKLFVCAAVVGWLIS